MKLNRISSLPALLAMYPSFFFTSATLFSDNFLTQMYLVLNISPFTTLYQFTVYPICEFLNSGSAQPLTLRKIIPTTAGKY